MADFYQNMVKAAAKLLKDKGQLITFTREVKGIFDPADGSYAAGTISTFDVNGATFDYKFPEIDGVNILKGDSHCLIESTPYIPQIGDTCVIDSVKWRVQDPQPLSPAGIPVIYDLQLRK